MTQPKLRPRRYSGLVTGLPVGFARTRGDARYNPSRYTLWKVAAGTIAQGVRRGRPKLEGPVGIELVVTAEGIVFEVWETAVTKARVKWEGETRKTVEANVRASNPKARIVRADSCASCASASP